MGTHSQNPHCGNISIGFVREESDQSDSIFLTKAKAMVTKPENPNFRAPGSFRGPEPSVIAIRLSSAACRRSWEVGLPIPFLLTENPETPATPGGECPKLATPRAPHFPPVLTGFLTR